MSGPASLLSEQGGGGGGIYSIAEAHQVVSDTCVARNLLHNSLMFDFVFGMPTPLDACLESYILIQTLQRKVLDRHRTYFLGGKLWLCSLMLLIAPCRIIQVQLHEHTTNYKEQT
jgi:hypothetical protein